MKPSIVHIAEREYQSAMQMAGKYATTKNVKPVFT